MIELRQRERRAQLKTARVLLLRDGDCSEERILGLRCIRRIALEQNLTAAAMQESVAPVFSLYGLSIVKLDFNNGHLSFFLSFFLSFLLPFLSFCSTPSGAHPFVPTCGLMIPTRGGAVKDGRRQVVHLRAVFPDAVMGPGQAARAKVAPVCPYDGRAC